MEETESFAQAKRELDLVAPGSTGVENERKLQNKSTLIAEWELTALIKRKLAQISLLPECKAPTHKLNAFQNPTENGTEIKRKQ